MNMAETQFNSFSIGLALLVITLVIMVITIVFRVRKQQRTNQEVARIQQERGKIFDEILQPLAHNLRHSICAKITGFVRDLTWDHDEMTMGMMQIRNERTQKYEPVTKILYGANGVLDSAWKAIDWPPGNGKSRTIRSLNEFTQYLVGRLEEADKLVKDAIQQAKDLNLPINEDELNKICSAMQDQLTVLKGLLQ